MEAVASPVSARTGERRTGPRTLAKFVLALAVLAALAAGLWGVISSLNTEASPARIGEAVVVPGGFLRVDQLTSEHMAPMQNSKFAASGMSMSSMGMDMAPEGQQRFAVDVTLAAERSDLSYSPQDFRISAKGIKEATPIRHNLGSGTLPAGGAISGSLVFQAPEEAKELLLSFGDKGGQKIALDLDDESTTESGDAHSHGAQSSQGHGDSPDDHSH